jgi:small-conductance mechanosensitive channel
MFLTPSLLGAVATSATALLSLSFVVATTCQEVLGSCIFLFVKHPFDVGDHVKVDKSELLVEHITLLYTTFVRIDTGERTQLPNNMLNGHWVDNVTRSQVIREKLSIRVAGDTDDEQIIELRERMEVEMHEWKVRITIEVVNILDMRALELQCGVEYKLGSSSRETGSENARGQLRSQIMRAWIAALRQVGIRAPPEASLTPSSDDS